MQTSHPLLPTSPPALNLSQHQGLFQWFSSSHQVAKVLELQLQCWFPLELTGLISLLSKGLSRVFSSITVGKHQFFSAQPSFGPTVTSVQDYWKNCSFDYMDLCGYLGTRLSGHSPSTHGLGAGPALHPPPAALLPLPGGDT